MKLEIDVCTEDIDVALVAFKLAINSGATNVSLNSYEDDDDEFLYLNLTLQAEHFSPIISYLDDGPFVSAHSRL